MSLDERLRSGLTEAAGRLSPVAESMAEPVLRRGRRLRWRGRAIAATSAIVIVGAGALLLPQVWPISPGPAPRSASIGPEEWEPASASEPGCISLGSFNAASELENADRVCGLFAPSSSASEAGAFQMTRVDGTSVWLVARDELEVRSVLVVPDVPVFAGRPRELVASATTAPLPGEPGERPAQDFCLRRLEGPCELRREFRQLLPSGDFWEMWTLDAGEEEEELHTVNIGTWTLEVFGIPLGGPEGEASAESIIRNLEWSEDEDGFLRLASRDEDRAPMEPAAANVRMMISAGSGDRASSYPGAVLRGCSVEEDTFGFPPIHTYRVYGPALSYEETDNGYRARWCADGRYLIEIDVPDVETARRFHESMTVAGSLDARVEFPSAGPTPGSG